MSENNQTPELDEHQERFLRYLEHMRQLIATHKFALIGVFTDEEKTDPSDKTSSEFVYTTGLNLQLLPEVLFASNKLSADELVMFVDAVARRYRDTRVAKYTDDLYFDIDVSDDPSRYRDTRDSKYEDEKIQRFHLRIVSIDKEYPLEHYMIQTTLITNQAVQEIHLIQISDAEGRYPGDEGFENIFEQDLNFKVVSVQ